MRSAVGISCLLAALGVAPTLRATEVVNGSFESGDFAGWSIEDIPGAVVPLRVDGAGVSGPDPEFFVSSPRDGSFAVLHAFDGQGPGWIRLGQPLSITADGTRLEFDFRAAWNLDTYCTRCAPRLFGVSVEEPGSRRQLAHFPVVTIGTGTRVADTGDLHGSVDLGGFVGQTVYVSFDFQVPDAFSGPGFFQLDNVRIAPSGWVASGALPSRSSNRIRWETVVGLREPRGLLGSGHGQLPGAGEPWSLDPSRSAASLDLQREMLFFKVRGLARGSERGEAGTSGVERIRATLICDADGSASGDSVWVDTQRVQLSSAGNATFLGSVGPLPAACLEQPDIVFVLRP